MDMPRSAIRYRSINATQPSAVLTPRTSRSQPSPAQALTTYNPLSWHIPFCTGMAITLLILLCGHFIN